MTKITANSKCVSWMVRSSSALLIMLMLSSISADELSPGSPGYRSINPAEKTLWSVVEALERQIPFTRKKVEAVFETPLGKPTDIEYFAHHPIRLAGGVEVKIDLRINHLKPEPGFLLLDIGGPCITYDETWQQYPELEPYVSSPHFSMNRSTPPLSRIGVV